MASLARLSAFLVVIPRTCVHCKSAAFPRLGNPLLTHTQVPVLQNGLRALCNRTVLSRCCDVSRKSIQFCYSSVSDEYKKLDRRDMSLYSPSASASGRDLSCDSFGEASDEFEFSVPLCERSGSVTGSLVDLLQWRKRAQELASSVGSQFLDVDGGPDAIDLLRELEWFLDDAVAACTTSLNSLDVKATVWRPCCWRDIKASLPSNFNLEQSRRVRKENELLAESVVHGSNGRSAFRSLFRERYADPVNELAADSAYCCDGIRENLAEMVDSEDVAGDFQDKNIGWPAVLPTSDRLARRLPVADVSSFSPGIHVLLRLGLDDLDKAWTERIQSRRPFQYLVGCAHWRDLVLSVQNGVLIPRPETEQLIDLAEAAIAAQTSLGDGIWADLGTGSGAIAIALARVLNSAGSVFAVDASSTSVALARRNVTRYLLQEKITVLQGLWFSPLRELNGKLAGVISNPPYIPSDKLERLQAEVRRHEPKLALDGGEDGMDDLRFICRGSAIALHSGGFLALETNGEEQADTLVKLLSSLRVVNTVETSGPFHCFENVKSVKDFAGIVRFVTATRC